MNRLRPKCEYVSPDDVKFLIDAIDKLESRLDEVSDFAVDWREQVFGEEEK